MDALDRYLRATAEHDLLLAQGVPEADLPMVYQPHVHWPRVEGGRTQMNGDEMVTWLCSCGEVVKTSRQP